MRRLTVDLQALIDALTMPEEVPQLWIDVTPTTWQAFGAMVALVPLQWQF